MHRTQVLLRDEQYLALRDLAKTEGRSMGQVIRELVDRGLSGEHAEPSLEQRTRLRALCGIVEDVGLGGADHDRELYGSE